MSSVTKMGKEAELPQMCLNLFKSQVPTRYENISGTLIQIKLLIEKQETILGYTAIINMWITDEKPEFPNHFTFNQFTENWTSTLKTHREYCQNRQHRLTEKIKSENQRCGKWDRNAKTQVQFGAALQIKKGCEMHKIP